MASPLLLAAFFAQSAIGFPGHPPRASECCDLCGANSYAVAREIAILQQSPRWRERDNAAHRLEKFDWKCHPEIVHALLLAMTRDCRDDVRAEAAETLGELSPCSFEVRRALKRTANCDPDDEPREEARKALKKLGKTCEGPCDACGAVARGVIVQPPSEPVLVLPPGELPPGTYYLPEGAPLPDPTVVPPGELPAPLPDSAPFEMGPEASRKAKERIASREREIAAARAREREVAAARAREAARRNGFRPLLLGRRLR